MRRNEQILHAAADLFLDRGFHNVTIDEIGAQVGITGPAIYRHFAGKDELLATLIDQAMDHLLLLVHRTGDDATPGEVLDALVRAQIDFVLADRALVKLYAREGQSLAQEYRRHASRRQREHVMRWVSAMAEVYPGRRRDQLHTAAHACIGLTLSVAHWPNEAVNTKGLEALLYELVLGALDSLSSAGS